MAGLECWLESANSACLKRMPYGAAPTALEVNSRLAEVVSIAQELHDITAAEFPTKLQFISAYRQYQPTVMG